MRGTGLRGPTGRACALRRMATEDPAHAAAIILWALVATDGRRDRAAVELRAAGLLGPGKAAYLALCRCVEAIDGLRAKIDSVWPGERGRQKEGVTHV